MKHFLFLLLFFSTAPALADVTITCEHEPTVGIEATGFQVYRWDFQSNQDSAIVIAQIPPAECRHVVTDHVDGVFEYCVTAVGTWVPTGQLVSSECSESVLAVVIDGGVKKSVTPATPHTVIVE